MFINLNIILFVLIIELLKKGVKFIIKGYTSRNLSIILKQIQIFKLWFLKN